MKTLKLLLFMFLAVSVEAQQQRIVNMYTPIDVGFYQSTLNQMQANFNEKAKYIKELMMWIIDLKSESTEKLLNQELDGYYNKLDKALNGDDERGLSTTYLTNIEIGIKKSVAEYNSRVADYNSKMAKENDPNIFFESGIEKLKNNDPEGAIIDFKKVENLVPDFAGSYYYLGQIYYYKLQFSNAIIYLTKALDRDQNNENALETRGWANNYSERYMEAITDFNQVLALNSQSSKAYFGRGYAKDNLGDRAGAIKDYEYSLKLDPTNSMVLNNIGWTYFEQGETKKALDYVNKAIEIDPTNYTAFDSRGEIKLKLNDLNGCISDCSKAIELSPSLSNSYLVRGKAFIKLGKKLKACEDWSKSGELGKSEAYDLIKKNCNK